MSPLELIRIGIENSEWDNVIEGYNRMTGESLEYVSIDQVNNNLEGLLEAALKKLRSPNKYAPLIGASEIEVAAPRTKKPKKTKKNIVEPSSVEEAIENLVKGDDQSYLPSKASARRPPVPTFKLKCSECGVEKEMYEAEYSMYNGSGQIFNCNKCLPTIKGRLMGVS